MEKGCRCVVVLLISLSICVSSWAQCEQQTDCSARCYPEHWKRELCEFYGELDDWRSTAINCGLDSSLPDIVWDQSEPPTVQWERARSLWHTHRQLWREQTTPTDTSDGESASGMLDLCDDNQVGEGVSGDLVTVWRQEQDDWLSELQIWRDIVGDEEAEGAEPPFDPSDLWRENLSNWADEFTTYNTTFHELCTRDLSLV